MDVDKNAFICISWLLSIFRPSPEPQRHDARRRHEEDEACGREKPAGITEIHFRQSAPPFLSLLSIFACK